MIKRQGQALVESVVAISVLMVGFMAILTLLNQSLSTSRVISEKTIATYLASEGIEAVKNQIDTNLLNASSGVAWNGDWTDGTNLDLTYDLATGESKLVSASDHELCYSGQAQHLYYSTSDGLCNQTADSRQTKYSRKISIGISGDEMKVVSEVRWVTRGNYNESVSLEDHFYKWKP